MSGSSRRVPSGWGRRKMVLKPSYHLPRGVWLEVLSSVDRSSGRSSGRSFGLGQLCGQVTEVNKWVPEGQFILCGGGARDVVMSGFTCAQLPAMWTLRYTIRRPRFCSKVHCIRPAQSWYKSKDQKTGIEQRSRDLRERSTPFSLYRPPSSQSYSQYV